MLAGWVKLTEKLAKSESYIVDMIFISQFNEKMGVFAERASFYDALRNCHRRVPSPFIAYHSVRERCLVHDKMFQ